MSKKPPRKFNLNGRTVTAPIAAFTMACILFVYARTSIHAAKQNAQKHREADGGQISWRNESLRRHGKLEAVVPQGTVEQLVGVEGKRRGGGVDGKGERDGKGGSGGVSTVEEERVREVAARRGRRE